jgi:hypothetical protein
MAPITKSGFSIGAISASILHLAATYAMLIGFRFLPGFLQAGPPSIDWYPLTRSIAPASLGLVAALSGAVFSGSRLETSTRWLLFVTAAGDLLGAPWIFLYWGVAYKLAGFANVAGSVLLRISAVLLAMGSQRALRLRRPVHPKLAA